MAKTSGLGDKFLVGGFDVSGHTNALNKIAATVDTVDITDITQFAHHVIQTQVTGSIDFTALMNIVGGAQNTPLSNLPTTDTLMTYCRGTALGGPVACLNAKQVGYDPTRSNKGDLTLKVAGVGNSFGLEWGIGLTPGIFTATNSLSTNASTFEGGIANWAGLTNCSVAQSSAQAHGGTKSLAVTSTAGGTMLAGHTSAGTVATNGFTATPGQQVLVATWVRSAVSVRTVSVGVSWYTSGAAFISTTLGSGLSDSTTGWTQVSATVVAPATAAFGIAVVQVASTGGASEVHYIDDVQYIILPGVVDNGSSTAFGAQAYYQLTAFTGTDITVSIQHSADNATWANLVSFTQATTVNTFQRVTVANTTTVNRYVQAIATTSGGFTAASFQVTFIRNPLAGVLF